LAENTQKNRLIRVKCSKLGDDDLLLRSFTGHEGISRLFHFDLVMLSTNKSINFDSVVGQPATITLIHQDGSSRFINGIFSTFTLGGTLVVDQGGKPVTFVEYFATLVPALWLLTRQSDCRIFQELNSLDILDKIISKDSYKAANITVSRRVDKPPDKREYCVQYRETDFNFISRLLEEDGIFYYFKHTEKQHVLVVGNLPSHFAECELDKEASFGLDPKRIPVTEWTNEQEIRPGKYVLKDFNFEDPNVDLTSDPAEGNDSRKLEIYDYPGEYTKKEVGTALAKIRIQEEDSPRILVNGAGLCRGFQAGNRFKLFNHFRSDLNREYILTSVYHSSNQGDNYRSSESSARLDFNYSNRFQCIPSSTPYRPPRVTPEPVMRGTQTATVVTKEGEEFLVDKFGRVKVRFHWDRETKRDNKEIKDEERSCFIRVSQPWAGTNWGGVWLPRKGQEVIVDFLEGDPDQPIITGRVYNETHMPPYTLPDNQTQSGFKSRSSPKGGSANFNEIRFEDKKGSELLNIHAELNKVESVEADSIEHVGHDRKLIVENDQKEHVKNNKHLHVKGDQKIKVEGSLFSHVQVDRAEKTDTGWSHDCGGAIQIKSGNEICFEAPMMFSIKCGGNFIVLNPAGIFIQGTLVMINSGGAAGVCVPFPMEDPEDPDPPQGGSKGS
jgi:type VI secretion system secreted protein VgrG